MDADPVGTLVVYVTGRTQDMRLAVQMVESRAILTISPKP